MKAPPRFYAPDMSAESSAVALPAEEASHLVRVLRLGAGDVVHVLNGRGLLRAGHVTAASRSGVRLELGAEVSAAVESRVHVTLAQALLKGDKMDDVVRDAAMAGAAAIQPIITAHTEPAVIRAAGRRGDRWRTIAIGSAKQSGRAVVPSIASPIRLDAALAMPADARVVLVEPSAAREPSAVRSLGELPSSAIIFTGPEGGWSADEVDAFVRARASLVTLPGPTWRADAIGLIAIVIADIAWHGREGWPL